MHELSIMQSTLELALEHATGAKSIRALRVRVGELSGVVPDALQFAFETLREGTKANEATLDVEFVPVLYRCGQCATEFRRVDYLNVCPACHRADAKLKRGLELELVSIEID